MPGVDPDMKRAAAVSLKLTQVFLGVTQVFNWGQTAAVNNPEIGEDFLSQTIGRADF